MKPLVSIITPYLNAEEFLAEAIASVEKQSLGNWELLLVDDGSTDSSRQIADAAGERDRRIRSLTRPSDRVAGAASARNCGIEEASGEYLTFLDADDLFLPEKLSTEISLMARFPDVGMTCGGTVWWHPGQEDRDWSDEIRSLRPDRYEPPVLLNLALLLQRAHVPSLCGVMVRREAVPTAAPFETSLSLYEDQTLLLKVLADRPVYVGRHLTALYRQHPSSTSSTAGNVGEYLRTGPHPARAKFLAWARTYFEERPHLLARSAEALLLAEALQSGDYSQVDRQQRIELMVWRTRKMLRQPPKRAWGWLRRRYLLLRLRDRRA
jgi:glycosyltransferase involved in cell wall biosynthesis